MGLAVFGNDDDLVVRVPVESAAARKLIRELQLRSHTGASIIGIERSGASLVNPGPDEELQPGDQVLLLGTRWLNDPFDGFPLVW